jgi:RNA polymerase sigma factor (sigma-70 family)
MSQNDILSDYLQSLYGIEPLSVAEEHQLADLIQQGDQKALEKLIKHNLRFVVYVVRSLTAWQHSKVPVEDILSMGNEALFMSARSWNPTNNSGFATYAKPFIMRGVKRELNNTENLIRLPVNIMLDIKKLRYVERSLSQKLCRQPTKAELSVSTKMSENRINELQAHILREPTCLNDLKNDEHFEEKHDD